MIVPVWNKTCEGYRIMKDAAPGGAAVLFVNHCGLKKPILSRDRFLGVTVCFGVREWNQTAKRAGENPEDYRTASDLFADTGIQYE